MYQYSNYPPDIVESRHGSWNGIQSRKHQMKQLYMSTSSANEFVVLGGLEILKSNGERVAMRFCAAVAVEQNEEGTVRIASYDAFAVR